MCIKEFFQQVLTGLSKIGDPAGNVVDIVEFIGMVGAVIIFFTAAFFPLMRPVRVFLRKYKMPLSDSFWLLWRSRNNSALFIRFYIESAIFKTEGYPMEREGWRELRRSFKNSLKKFEKNDVFEIEVDSVSVMISDDVKTMIAEYFAFLAGERECKRFWTKANVDSDKLRKDAFCSVVTVRGGYLAPLARIAGINDRYEENWKDIMDNFARTCGKSLLPQSVFSYTYTWLMWGPSIQTAKLDTMGTDVLGIYGISDEAQSLFVSIPRSIFESHFNDGVICTPCKVSGHIVNSMSYVESHQKAFNDDSTPFLDRIKQRYRTDREYILDVDEMKAETDHDHYFTAYVWAMFLAADPNDAKPIFRFSNAVAFFEHTNLSDRNGKSLKKVNSLLAGKFKSAFTSPDGKKLKYYFACSLNQDTADVLKKELGKLGNVCFDNRFSVSDVLEAIDSHFVDTEKWEILPADSYGELIPLCNAAFGKTAKDELAWIFAKLSDEKTVVIAIKNNYGTIAAAGIAEFDSKAYKITKPITLPDSIITDSNILAFSDREIKTLLRAR